MPKELLKEELIGGAETPKAAKQRKLKGTTRQSQQGDNISLPVTVESSEDRVNAKFIEDDNFIDMDISGIRSAFPSEDEDEEDEQGQTLNNNATVVRDVGFQNKQSALLGKSRETQGQSVEVPHCSKDDPQRKTNKKTKRSNRFDELRNTISLMQDYMLEKGIIDNTMTEEEIKSFLDKTGAGKQVDNTGEPQSEEIEEVVMPIPVDNPIVEPTAEPTKQQTRQKQLNPNSSRKGMPRESGSEVTIYSRAVKPAQGDINLLGGQIDKLLNDVRHNTVSGEGSRKLSSSSDEMMDTSDETERSVEINNNSSYFPDLRGEEPAARHRTPAREPPLLHRESDRQNDPDEQPTLVLDAEQHKATMYEVPGKVKAITSLIDEDYQMIDAHIDEALKQKIVRYEFIDFSRLISKNHFASDEDNQRLEIVNRNGYSYFSPVSDRESYVQINSFNKWEQAFRVYSNILTSKYPAISTELLQYNHTIHTASTTYSWENVYAYDKEFRHHISRHPYRSWSVILQQAWTMILKDRIGKTENLFQRGNGPRSDKIGQKEICKRFNKGKCHYGLACIFDHRCAIRKCGKFGHGAHICRLRNQQDQGTNVSASTSQDNAASLKSVKH